METGEVIYEKVYASPRLPPKISLKHDWMKELRSVVAQRPEGQVVQQSQSSQSNEPNPNRDHDRTETPVVCCDENHERPTVVCSDQASHPRFSREGQNLIFEDALNHDRTEKPVVCRYANHERSMLNEVDIDFRIPGFPHSVVKQADNCRVRELVTKIENHPYRHSLQRDLQQNNAHNPFSEKSQMMIKDMGNVELFELFETEPKTQCKECFLYWKLGIIYCTCEHLLNESEASRGAIQCTLDLLLIPNYVIKKGRHHGHRYGKTTPQRDCRIAHNLREMHQEEFSRDPPSFLERS